SLRTPSMPPPAGRSCRYPDRLRLMAVQFHYYGSVFDLDPNESDSTWVGKINAAIADVAEHSNGGVDLRLADGRMARILLHSSDPIAIVAEPQAFIEP